MFYSVSLREKFPFFVSFEKRKLNKYIEQRILEYCSVKKSSLVDIIYIFHDHVFCKYFKDKSENYNLNYIYFFIEYRLILFKIEHKEIVYGRLTIDFDIGVEFKNEFIICFIPKMFFFNFFDPFVYNMKNEIIYGVVESNIRVEMKNYRIVCGLNNLVLNYNLKKLALIKHILL
uniref:Uncharacterized protein n=1 Tax=Lotharella vacuolata TaxID=74820 RepID=A0A0H5BQT5_9EUKA|nr:hypothetical protein [Lotharella vacuolata]